jgi:hypothetical protein
LALDAAARKGFKNGAFESQMAYQTAYKWKWKKKKALEKSRAF